MDQVDAVVIGAGVVGLAVARALALQGREVMVLDASDITRGPLAQIILPERMSVGTHACWVEGDRLQGENRRVA